MLLRSGSLSLLNLDLGLEKQFEMFKFRPFKFVSPDNYVSRIPPLFAMPKKGISNYRQTDKKNRNFDYLVLHK